MNKKGMKQSAKLSIDLITTIIVTLIAGAVTVAAVISMAWFASNKEVGTNGSSVTVDAELFELGVVSHFEKNESTNPTSEFGFIETLINFGYYNGNSIDFPRVTSPEHDSIICKLQSDDGNPIRPGSTGTLTFYILPKKDGLVFEFTPTLSGLQKKGNVYSYIDPAEYSTLDLSDADYEEKLDLKTALDLLHGHILFYFDPLNKQSTGISVFEEGFYVSGDNEGEMLEAGQVYMVSIYWEWPKIYEDLLNDYEIIVDENNRHFILLDEEGSNGYNNADQKIGEKFSHVVVQMSGMVVDSIPLGETELSAVKVSAVGTDS